MSNVLTIFVTIGKIKTKTKKTKKLLDDDKFSVPYDLMEVQGYVYFEFNREYHKAVRNSLLKLFSFPYKNTNYTKDMYIGNTKKRT